MQPANLRSTLEGNKYIYIIMTRSISGFIRVMQEELSLWVKEDSTDTFVSFQMLICFLRVHKTFLTLPFCCKVYCQRITESLNLSVQSVATEVYYMDNWLSSGLDCFFFEILDNISFLLTLLALTSVICSIFNFLKVSPYMCVLTCLFFFNNYYFANWMKQKSTIEREKKKKKHSD